MRRRMITVLLACVALIAPLAVAPAAPAQTSAAPASATAPASTTAPGVSAQTPRQQTDRSRGALVLLGLVGVALLVTGVVWGMARWSAWEPRWLLRWRHATAEAGWRTSAAWAEFRDWVRLGR
jgi:hypothetical protein